MTVAHLFVAIACFAACSQIKASARSLHNIHSDDVDDANAKDRLQTTFDELVYGAEHLHSHFKSEAAAVNQARTAFLLCPMCHYAGPQLTFLGEMFGIDTLQDRKYIMERIFPSLKVQLPAAAHLWVGVRPYSTRYEYILRAAGASRFDSIEPDTSQILYGSSQNHFVDIAQNIHKYVGPGTYDIVIANGVLGWGIDSLPQIHEFYSATARVMKKDGFLVIGYNAHIGKDHTHGIDQFFRKTTIGSLPQRMQFESEWRHTFELYQKISK